MNPGDKPRRPFGLGAYLLMLVGVALVSGLAGAGLSLFGGQSGPHELIITAATLAVIMGIGFAFSVWWWRGIDEAAREAHKWAWWWGGSGGMALGTIVLVTLTLSDDASTPDAVGASAADLVAGGMWIILMFQIAGYAVAWAFWWLKHR